MSSYLYLVLNGLTLFFPLVLSFDKKVAFYKTWPGVFLGVIFVGIPFIIWDIFFTKAGIWGFNPTYLTGITIYNLPIEEVLFFITVPFACTFIYACAKAYFHQLKFQGLNRVFVIFLSAYTLGILLLGWGGVYTMTTVFSAILLGVFLIYFRSSLRHLPVAFLFGLIGFFLVNGVLTGAVTENPVVWYNDLENTGVRIYTIPMDDIIYGWVLLSGNILVFQKYLHKKGFTYQQGQLEKHS